MAQPLWKSLAVSYKIRHAVIIPPSNLTPWHLSQRNENTCSHKLVHEWS